MSVLFETQFTLIGPEVADLLDGAVLILFRDGAPAELAEVSVLHREAVAASLDKTPAVGDKVTIDALSVLITGMGEEAWKKVVDLGHVVFNFNGETETDRPGEICLSTADPAALAAAVKSGAVLRITR